MPGTLLAAYTHDGASTDTFIEDLTGNGHGYAIGPGQANSLRVAGKTGMGLSQTVQDAAGFGPTIFGTTAQRTLMLNYKQAASIIAWAWEWFIPSILSGSWGLLWLDGQLHVQARNADSFVRASVAFPTLNTWHNACATYDGTTVRLYVDGVLAASTPLAGPIRTDAAFRVLDQAGPNLIIDDVRIWDGCLTDEEVAAWAPLPADQMPAAGGRLKYESAPGVWTPVPLKLATGEPLIVKSETSPGTWEALP